MMNRDEQFDPENVSNSLTGVDADTNIYVTPGAARPVTIQTNNGTEIRPIPGAAPVIIAPVVVPTPPGPGSSPIPANAYGTAYNGTSPAAPVNGAGQPAQSNPGAAPIPFNGYNTTTTATTSYGQPGQINPGVVSTNGQTGQPQQLNPANGYGPVYTGTTTATTSYNGATQPSQGNPNNSRGNGANQASPTLGNAAGATPGTITMNNYGQPVQGNQPNGAAANGYGQPQNAPAYVAPYNNGVASQPSPTPVAAETAPNTVNPANGYGQPVQGGQTVSSNPATGNANGYGQPQGTPVYTTTYNNSPAPQASPATANGYNQPAQAGQPNGAVNAYGQPVSNSPASGNANAYGQSQPPIPVNGQVQQQAPIPNNANGYTGDNAPIPANSYGTVYSGTPYSAAPAPTTPTSSFTSPAQPAQGNAASQGPYTYSQSGPIPSNAGQGYTTSSTATPSQAAQPNGAAYSSTSPNLAPTYIINYGAPAAAQGNPNGDNAASKQNGAADPYGTSYTSTGTANTNGSRSNTGDGSNVAYGSAPSDTYQREPRPRAADAVVDNSNQENASNNSRYNEPSTTSSTRTTTTSSDANPQDYEAARLTRKTTTQQTTTKDAGGSHTEKHTNINWGGIAKGVAAIAAVVVVGVGVYYGAGALTSAAINSPTFGPMIQGVVDFSTPVLATARDGISYAAGYLSEVPGMIVGGFKTLFGISTSSAATGAGAAVSATVAAPAVTAAATVAPVAPSVAANAGLASKAAGWLFGSGAALWVADHNLFPTIEHTHALNHTEQLVTSAPVTETKTIVETIPEPHVHADHSVHVGADHADHAAHTAAEMGLQAHELDHLRHTNHSHAMANASHSAQRSDTSHSDQGDLSVDTGDISPPDADVSENMLKRIEARGSNWRNRTSGGNNFSDSLNKSGSYRTAVESNRGSAKNVEPSDSYIADLEAARDALGEPSRV